MRTFWGDYVKSILPLVRVKSFLSLSQNTRRQPSGTASADHVTVAKIVNAKMSIPALEAFGTVAFRAPHSGFRNTNVQQPGDTDRLRVARGIATRDWGSDWHVSSSMCIVARGSRPVSPPGAGCPGSTSSGTGRLVCT